MHPDPEAAETPPFGGLIASGSPLVAPSVRLLVDHPHRAAAIPGLGWERVRFMEPVREGDTLTLTRECLEARRSRSGASRGVIRNRIALTNQHGMRVLESWLSKTISARTGRGCLPERSGGRRVPAPMGLMRGR